MKEDCESSSTVSVTHHQTYSILKEKKSKKCGKKEKNY
jgi:hypothetical protein